MLLHSSVSAALAELKTIDVCFCQGQSCVSEQNLQHFEVCSRKIPTAELLVTKDLFLHTDILAFKDWSSPLSRALHTIPATRVACLRDSFRNLSVRRSCVMEVQHQHVMYEGD